MSQWDVSKHHVIRNVLEDRISQGKAARVLRLSARQVRRLCVRVSIEGARGVVHRLRGRPSNNQSDPGLLEMALCALHQPLWEGFGPTFASDKLEELHGIRLNKESLRQLMLQTDIWHGRRRGWRHRSRRERRPCVGMLVQLDGSVHDWFEGRGPRCVLLVYIDDATSRILYAEFVKVEDTLTLMKTTWAYLRKWGRAVAYYVDRDGIYKINRPSKYEGSALDEKPMTQFTRAMSELGIEVITANSPQAKGRVERGFDTHQDRLVKELRLRGISAMAEANRFLWQEYIPKHNDSYAVESIGTADAHRPLSPSHKLEQILSLRTEHTLMNDYTLCHEKKIMQVFKNQPVRVGPRDKVEVEERLDGTIHLRSKGAYLNFKLIEKRPYRPLLVAQPSRTKQYDDPRVKGVGSIPAKNHHWRRLFLTGPYRVNLPSAGVLTG